MWLEICDIHLSCKVANKCLNICEWVEVVEWNKRWSPSFPCCPVSRQSPWKETLIKGIYELDSAHFLSVPGLAWQAYLKCGKMGLQNVLGWWITKCGNSGLQSVLGVGLQSVTKWITKCVRDYKVAGWITSELVQ